MSSRRSSTALSLVAALFAVTLAVVPGAAASQDADQEVGTAIDIALDHVQDQRGELGVSAQDLSEVLVTDAYRSQHSGVTHVYLRQALTGIEIVGANTTVNISSDGEVLHAPSRFLQGVAEAASGEARLSASQAVHAGARQLDLGSANDLRVLRSEEDPARSTLLTSAALSLSPIPARLVYQPAEDGRIRLAWNIQIEEPTGHHWWNASIDAETGELLATFDLVDHDSAEDTAAAIARPGGHGPAAAAITQPAAFAPAPADPDPVPDGASYRVYAWPLESPNDGDRTLVADPADPVASPFGWHDVSGEAGADYTITRGNNVHAYADTINASIPDPGSEPDGGASLTFDFPLDESMPPPEWRHAAVTNLFYWNNIIHDVFYGYGFDEVAGNFQVNNYGRGGIGGDDVRAEAQDGGGVNNANFATPADGQRPRMQMYMWAPPVPYVRADPTATHVRDGDLDAGIIVHEYAHGISNRLTGGPGAIGCLSNDEQMGEGWSDWLAIALTAMEGERGEDPRGMGTYALYQDDRTGAGIRPRPYSTDMNVNWATYNTVKSSAVPHGVGYVWATMLWDLYWALVDDHGFNSDAYAGWASGGNNLAIQLVMDGMKFQPCSPGFVDGRDAIVAADVALTGGDNQCTIWDAFARRGLGYSADQGESASRSDGTEAFDPHPDCT